MEANNFSEKPKRSVFRRILRVITWLLVLVVFFCGVLISLLFIYQDEVKAAIVSELNKHLKAEVKIDPKNIDLTIIRSFPDCSIQFTDLLMLEALPVNDRDTLLYAGRLNLHFNIRNLWNKKYEIRKIKLKDGVAKLRILKDGRANYIFWETQKTNQTHTKDSIHFDLKLISIEHLRLSYKDRKNGFKTRADIQKLSFSGHFSDSEFDLSSDAKIFIHECVSGKINYLKNKNCAFSVNLKVENDLYTIKKADLNLNKLKLALNGQCRYRDNLQNLDLSYNAFDLDIASLLSLLPEKHKEKIIAYESKGNFYSNGKIHYAGRNAYAIESDFGVKNGEIIYKPKSATARQVNVEGHLRLTQKTSMLDLKNISLRLNTGEIKGSCSLHDFSQPFIKLSGQANVDLESLQSFWPMDTLSKLKGKLQLVTEAEGLWSDLTEQTFSSKVKLNLDATVSQLEAQFKHDEKNYMIENCQVTASNGEIEIKDLMLKRGASDIKLSGKIPGLFNHLIDKSSPLIISGNLFSNHIRLEDFMSDRKSVSASEDAPLIPKNINFKLNAAVLKFTFGKFEAQSVTGELEIKNQKAIVSDMKLQTMKGTATIDAFADNSKGELDVALEGELDNLDIQQLFAQLNNFGQTILTDKHLRGSASATIDFSASWTNKLEVNPGSITSVCKLDIEGGELIEFKPLLSLSKFVDVEDLKHIRFSSLKSAIEIKDNKIIIPKTAIENTVLNIDASGIHGFDNSIEYHIQLSIDQYLAKRRRKKDSEFGIIENDPENRRSAFILMTGTVENPRIKYDVKGLREKMKDNLREENKNLKQLFKEEWNLFKKDTTLKKSKKPETVFELEKPEPAKPKKTLELKKKKEEDDDF